MNLLSVSQKSKFQNTLDVKITKKNQMALVILFKKCKISYGS